jgi:DNA-binding transcriptional ArsR family regulator
MPGLETSPSQRGRLSRFTDQILQLERLVHEPPRLAVLTVLARSADGGAYYLHLRNLTSMSKGNLSNHLAKLEEAGLVDIGKHFEGKKPVTTVRPAPEGSRQTEAYWSAMEEIARASRPERGREGA